MQFQSANILWFLLLCLIPVIIHLFRFKRYRKVEFTRVDLLKQITVKTGLGNKLRKLLIMTLRILAIASLVFAFAYPFIPEKDGNDSDIKNKLIIFLDNSLSMSGDGAEGSLFEAAKNRARNMVGELPSDYNFHLLSHSYVDFSNVMDKEQIIEEIDRLSFSNKTLTEKEIFSQMNSLQDKSSISAYISDFRKGFINNFPQENSYEGKSYWLPVPASPEENISIDSAWFFSPQLLPEQNVKLNVKLSNHGKENVKDLNLRLVENDISKAVANVSIDAGSSTIAEMSFKAGSEGWKNAFLEIPGDNFHFDDSYFLSYAIQKGSKGIILSEDAPIYLKGLFANSDEFSVEYMSPLQAVYDKFPKMDFIICAGLKDASSGLADELKKFVENGGNLLVIPSESENQDASNTILSKLQSGSFGKVNIQDISADIWDLRDPLLQGVFDKTPKNIDLPHVFKYFPISGANRQINFWKMKNGSALVARLKRGSGTVFLLAVPLNKSFTNLQDHPLFVPFVLRIASYKEADRQLAFETGTEDMIPLQNIVPEKDEVWKLRNNDIELIPEIAMRDKQVFILTHGSITEPGAYSLLDAKSQDIYHFSFNLPRTESVSDVEDINELKNKAKEYGAEILFEKPEIIAKEIKKSGEGRPLWKYFVFASLLFLAAEMILLRVWKV